MTTQISSRRDPWYVAWRLAAGKRSLGIVLFALALYLAALALIPQFPRGSPTADRWFVQTQARFGTGAEPLYRLGLFSLRDSPIFPILLAAVAFLLIVRAVEEMEALWSVRERRERPPHSAGPWPSFLRAIACIGFLLLLLGLLIGRAFGWRIEGLIGHPGDRLDLAGYGEVVLQSIAGGGVRSAQPGAAVYVTGDGPELSLQAYDAQGRGLGMQRTYRDAPEPELTLTLTLQSPEAYFAVPEVDLVARIGLTPGATLSAGAPLWIEVFRAPKGERVQAIEMAEPALEMTVEGTRLRIVRQAYLVLDVAHNPGHWPQAAGWVMGIGGLLSASLWPQRKGGGRKRAFLAILLLQVPLTLVVAGIVGRNLATIGRLWNRSPLEAGLGALWLGGLALEQILTSQEDTE